MSLTAEPSDTQLLLDSLEQSIEDVAILNYTFCACLAMLLCDIGKKVIHTILSVAVDYRS